MLIGTLRYCQMALNYIVADKIVPSAVDVGRMEDDDGALGPLVGRSGGC